MTQQTQIIDARRSDDYDEAEGGRWVTVCPHGEFVQHLTRADARWWVTDMGVWCPRCREADAVAARTARIRSKA